MTETDPSSPQATLDGVPHGAGRLRLAVVLPTLNERKNLRKLVARLDEALGDIGWEAIFVDDNSPDGTADEARAINQEDPRIRVIQRIGRRGLASAAIEGMCSTAAPVVAVMDADHQHDPKLLPQMLAAIESGDYDVLCQPLCRRGQHRGMGPPGPREGVGLCQCAGAQGDGR
jgi:dolichol-phosphate mannosyltransferase